jgi:hypothetical protein
MREFVEALFPAPVPQFTRHWFGLIKRPLPQITPADIFFAMSLGAQLEAIKRFAECLALALPLPGEPGMDGSAPTDTGGEAPRHLWPRSPVRGPMATRPGRTTGAHAITSSREAVPAPRRHAADPCEFTDGNDARRHPAYAARAPKEKAFRSSPISGGSSSTPWKDLQDEQPPDELE